VVHQSLDLITLLTWSAAPKWYSSVVGTAISSLTMYMCSTYKLWPGPNLIVQVSFFLFHRKSLGPAPCPRKGHCAILIGTNLVIHGGFQYTDEAMKAAGFKN
jgi:hypothetical protein